MTAQILHFPHPDDDAYNEYIVTLNAHEARKRLAAEMAVQRVRDAKHVNLRDGAQTPPWWLPVGIIAGAVVWGYVLWLLAAALWRVL